MSIQHLLLLALSCIVLIPSTEAKPAVCSTCTTGCPDQNKSPCDNCMQVDVNGNKWCFSGWAKSACLDAAATTPGFVWCHDEPAVSSTPAATTTLPPTTTTSTTTQAAETTTAAVAAPAETTTAAVAAPAETTTAAVAAPAETTTAAVAAPAETATAAVAAPAETTTAAVAPATTSPPLCRGDCSGCQVTFHDLKNGGSWSSCRGMGEQQCYDLDGTHDEVQGTTKATRWCQAPLYPEDGSLPPLQQKKCDIANCSLCWVKSNPSQEVPHCWESNQAYCEYVHPTIDAGRGVDNSESIWCGKRDPITTTTPTTTTTTTTTTLPPTTTTTTTTLPPTTTTTTTLPPTTTTTTTTVPPTTAAAPTQKFISTGNRRHSECMSSCIGCQITTAGSSSSTCAEDLNEEQCHYENVESDGSFKTVWCPIVWGPHRSRPLAKWRGRFF